MPENFERYLAAAEEAARAAAGILRQWRGKVNVREKAPADLVTEADLASQKKIQEILRSRFSSHQVLGEEDPDFRPSTEDYCWVIDPLDGTTNFVHQVPHYCVSIALVHRGQTVVGLVYEPNTDECFSAMLGGGARLNGRALRVSSVQKLTDALVALSFPTAVSAESPEVIDLLRVLPLAQAIRRTGSAALNLCYVAAGRFDAFWAHRTNSWDVAAGGLIVTEARGLMTGIDGQPFDVWDPDFLAAATPDLHRKLLGLVYRKQ